MVNLKKIKILVVAIIILFTPSNIYASNMEDILIDQISTQEEGVWYPERVESKDFYIYQPLTILKLWNKETDDTDVSTFSDLNFIFFVKSLIKIKKFEKFFKHLQSYIDNDSNNNCSSIFCYLFGKVLALAITFRICTGSLGSFLSQRSNYSMIKLTMISFGSDTKIKNYSRLEKNYRRLALISKYYKIEQGIIDNYLEKAKI